MDRFRQNPMRSVNLEEWDDRNYSHISFQESAPDAIDEPWPYRFQHGDYVWVRSRGLRWYPGQVLGQPKAARTIKGDGLFWLVDYSNQGHQFRRFVAPLDGDLKPDTPHTRTLLKKAGY
ncbi:uncharacterized protein EDB91DRAFT_1052234 [Suillus paluster]|uniref:uncharacterized protein n=1 Tax=Suillus paluster TaxID=48578 RepID=UPI001B87CA58|nr:uncharacterized protein EDB91DRAFT_1052234 [Suillus paluster]KAG1741765.1 hypothetical protein EDB91DRAFT_1052234 [Suillus paluster]